MYTDTLFRYTEAKKQGYETSSNPIIAVIQCVPMTRNDIDKNSYRVYFHLAKIDSPIFIFEAQLM